MLKNGHDKPILPSSPDMPPVQPLNSSPVKPSTAKARKPAVKKTSKVEAPAVAPATLASATRAPRNAPEVAHNDIARLAYLLAESRGFIGGSPESDWLRAESFLKTRG